MVRQLLEDERLEFRSPRCCMMFESFAAARLRKEASHPAF